MVSNESIKIHTDNLTDAERIRRTLSEDPEVFEASEREKAASEAEQARIMAEEAEMTGRNPQYGYRALNRRYIKKIDKGIGITKIKNQIRSINALLVFLVVAGAYAIYLNHTGAMLSYGVIVAASAMLILAGFLSYRIRQQVKLESMKVEYGQHLVKPVVEKLYREGKFSHNGGLTELELLNTNLFSDSYEYEYTTCNEITGFYKRVQFESTDVTEIKNKTNKGMMGRVFQFTIPTRNTYPIIFTNPQAPAIERRFEQLHLVKTGRTELDKRFKTYCFDEEELKRLMSSSFEYKLLSISKLGLGRVVKMSFYNDRICVYYSTDKPTFEEYLTKKHKTEKEVENVVKTFSIIDKLIDILQ